MSYWAGAEGTSAGDTDPSPRALTVAVAQIDARGSDALERGLAAARRAFTTAGARLVVLPELSVPGYTVEPSRLAEAAEPIDGPTVTAWAQLAREHGGWIAGGFVECEGSERYNTAVVVGADGPVLHYRKLHLFDGEKEVFSPGNLGLPVVELPFGRIGLCVCYDLRFVEVLRTLALRGAEIVAVPTAWIGGFDPQLADVGPAPQSEGARVQANLDNVFVACASATGRVGAAPLLGSSLIVDPWGISRAGPLPREGEGLIHASLDLDDVARAHTRSPRIRPVADRRTDVYALAVDGIRL